MALAVQLEHRDASDAQLLAAAAAKSGRLATSRSSKHSARLTMPCPKAGPLNPVSDMIAAVQREAGDAPEEHLADEHSSGGDLRIAKRLRPVRPPWFAGW